MCTNLNLKYLFLPKVLFVLPSIFPQLVFLFFTEFYFLIVLVCVCETQSKNFKYVFSLRVPVVKFTQLVEALTKLSESILVCTSR